jgi:hypothetical protein
MRNVLILPVAISGVLAMPAGAQTTKPEASPPAARAATHSTMSAAERAAGWTNLFDGRSLEHWRGYRSQSFPSSGWTIDDGCLHVVAGGGGGDIITRDSYGDFELTLEWKVAPKANSGIIYRLTEAEQAPWQTGPEYQILDDAGHDLDPTDPHSAGALYDMYPPSAEKVTRPAGEFNATRIRIRNNVVEHWLNGVKVVEVDMNGDAWAQRIAESKFRGYKGFGVQPTGHIALQDHGNEVWFRNIKVRDLSAPMPDEVRLFNGRDLTGWTAFLQDDAGMDDVWTVEDGVLICTGTPAGYVRTVDTYENYVLKLEWRWDPASKKAGNSGVLLRMVGEDRVWPRSVEAQLMSGSAGDFWAIDDYPMKTAPERTRGRNTRKMHAAEHPVGEWNEYEIIVDHGRVTLKVNGQLVNEAWEVEEQAGHICLQSEGAEIHFRNIRLAPIE